MKQPLATFSETEIRRTARSVPQSATLLTPGPKVFEIKDTTVKNIGRTKSFPPEPNGLKYGNSIVTSEKVVAEDFGCGLPRKNSEDC